MTPERPGTPVVTWLFGCSMSRYVTMPGVDGGVAEGAEGSLGPQPQAAINTVVIIRLINILFNLVVISDPLPGYRMISSSKLPSVVVLITW